MYYGLKRCDLKNRVIERVTKTKMGRYGRKNILNAAKNCDDYKNDLIKDIDDGGGGDTTKKEWQA